MTQPADGQLKPVLAKFRAAVADLCDKTPMLHTSGMRYADSLYQQLDTAIAGNNPAPGNGTAKSRPPIWTDALDLKQEIDLGVTSWCNGTTTPNRLRWLAEQDWRPQDTHKLDRWTRVLTAWCQDIRDLFDPPHVKTLSAACPACGATHAYRKDQSGEHIRTPALQIIAGRGCTCIACHHTWQPDHYLHLCRVLGYELPAGVLE